MKNNTEEILTDNVYIYIKVQKQKTTILNKKEKMSRKALVPNLRFKYVDYYL